MKEQGSKAPFSEDEKQGVLEAQERLANDGSIDKREYESFMDALAKPPLQKFRNHVFSLCVSFIKKQCLPLIPAALALYISFNTGGDILSYENILLMVSGACLLVQFLLSVRGAVLFFKAHDAVFNLVCLGQRTLRETTHSSGTQTGKVLRTGFIASAVSSLVVAILSITYVVAYSMEEGLVAVFSHGEFLMIPMVVALQALCAIHYHDLGDKMKKELGPLSEIQRDINKRKMQQAMKED